MEHEAGEVVQLPGLKEGRVHNGPLVEHMFVHLVHAEYLVVQLLPHEDGVEVSHPGQKVFIPVPEIFS